MQNCMPYPISTDSSGMKTVQCVEYAGLQAGNCKILLHRKLRKRAAAWSDQGNVNLESLDVSSFLCRQDEKCVRTETGGYRIDGAQDSELPNSGLNRSLAASVCAHHFREAG
jgi:hypothetical protein